MISLSLASSEMLRRMLVVQFVLASPEVWGGEMRLAVPSGEKFILRRSMAV